MSETGSILAIILAICLLIIVLSVAIWWVVSLVDPYLFRKKVSNKQPAKNKKLEPLQPEDRPEYDHPEFELSLGGSCASLLVAALAFIYAWLEADDSRTTAIVIGIIFAFPLLLYGWMDELKHKEHLNDFEKNVFRIAGVLLKILKVIGIILLVIAGIYFISTLSPMTIIIILLIALLFKK